MAVISVDPLSSPRVITVLEPDIAISVQELVNLVRAWETIVADTEFPHLINASGKEVLGIGTYVGITVALQNARLAFAARPGPAFEQCLISGGNLVAVDINGDPISPIHTTAYTQVTLAQSSSPTLLIVEIAGAGVWTDPRALTVGKFVALK